MTFRVEVVWVGEEGDELRSGVLAMERGQLAMETLGLNLSESKAMLEGVQDFVVAQQSAVDLKQRRRCPSCSQRYTGKTGGTKGKDRDPLHCGSSESALETMPLPEEWAQDISADRGLAGWQDKSGIAVRRNQVGILDSVREVRRIVA